MQEEENQAEIPGPVGKPKTKKFWAALIAVDCAALALFSFLAYRYLDDQPPQAPVQKVATPAQQAENKPTTAPAPQQEAQTPVKSSTAVTSNQISESSGTAAKTQETKPEEKIAVSPKAAPPQHVDASPAQPKSTAATNGSHTDAPPQKTAPVKTQAAKPPVQTKPAAAPAKTKPAQQTTAHKPQNNGKYSGIANGAKAKETAPAPAKARPVYFTYQNNAAKSVAVTGSFTIWKPIPMHKNGNYWEATVYIHSGKYEYSLIVDGKTIADPAAPAKGPERSFLLVP